MFLGTSRGWWIAAGVCFVLGLFLVVGGDTGGMLGNVLGVLLIVAAVILFAAAPMRYGRNPPQAPATAAPEPHAPPLPINEPPRPRPNIEGRDARDV